MTHQPDSAVRPSRHFPSRGRTSAVTSALLLLLGVPAQAANWPAWRGPEGTGHCPEKDLPLRWSVTENVRWKTPLPDKGNSTPVIWGERIFLTQATDQGRKRSTLCLHRQDGRKLWEQTTDYPQREPTHETNYYCSA